jgi:hypothetical protein
MINSHLRSGNIKIVSPYLWTGILFLIIFASSDQSVGDING